MRMVMNLAVSIVLALALVFGVRGFANLVFNAKPPAQPAIEVPQVEEAKPEEKKEEAKPAEKAAAEKPAQEAAKPAEQAAAEPAAEQPAAQQPAAQPAAAGAGDPAKGKKVFNKCKACHFADKEKNKVGPHLVGIIGRPVASVEGFKYSPAMQGKASEIGNWTKENLTKYLSNPKGFVPGNKMAFAGLKKPEDIANLLAYLESLAK